MENKKRTPSFLRQRKFLVILPLLAMPFMSLAFWALGGGKTQTADAQSIGGFNRDLPGVNLREGMGFDKMSYYSQADIDSAKLQEQKKNDPFYLQDTAMEFRDLENKFSGYDHSNNTEEFNGNNPYNGNSINEENEQKVYQKLNQLNAAMAQSGDEGQTSGPERDFSRPKESGSGTDVQKLESMMQVMNGRGESDPEMDQLNGMLEKISEVQNPGLIEEKLRLSSEQKRGRVFPVLKEKKFTAVSVLGSNEEGLDNATAGSGDNQPGFFSTDVLSPQEQSPNAIEAFIAASQTVVSGSTVKMKLSADVFINGIRIRKGNFIYGTASLSGERLSIKINSIRYGNNLFPVELSVFDMDGLEGLYVPGAINRDVAKESADRGLQNIGFSTLDPSIGMQAAGVGVAAAKSLLGKKVKLVRVTVKAGYQVLLRDEKQKQQN